MRQLHADVLPPSNGCPTSTMEASSPAELLAFISTDYAVNELKPEDGGIGRKVSDVRRTTTSSAEVQSVKGL